MRLILSNADADRLLSALDSAVAAPTVELRPPRTCVLHIDGQQFTGKARPTPGALQGVLRVENMDGRIVVESM